MFVFWRGTGQQWPATGTGALGAADLGAAYALLEVIAINPTIEPPELTKYWGNRLSEDTKIKCCVTRTQEKGAVTPHETDPDLPVNVQESRPDAWVSSGQLQGWGQSVALCAWDFLKEVAIFFITSTIVWPRVKQQREHSPTHQKKIGLKIY